MPESAFDEITARNKEKHNHWNGQTGRCYKCGAFVSKGKAEDGVYKYDCHRCGKVFEAMKTSIRSLQD